MTENALEVRNLRKDYGDFVLDKLSFTLPRGVIMGLIGENGAGKSTTINCILNEIQKDAGEILIFDKDNITDEKESKASWALFLTKTISPTFLLPLKLAGSWPGFIVAGSGPPTDSFSKSLNCPRVKKSRTFQRV